MSFCVVVQKDTLENDKVKTVVASCEDPREFVQDLQSGHCIEYQLLAHTNKSSELVGKVNEVISHFKTSFGVNWYDLNHVVLGQVLTLFLENGSSTINLRSISEIMRFSLKIVPAVTKEIKISAVHSEQDNNGEEIISLLENLQVPEKESRRKKEVKKESSKKIKKET